MFEATLDFIGKRTKIIPKFGVILGTGLKQFAELLDIEAKIKYEDIPRFPISTVDYHKGQLLFGKMNNQPVVVMQGRMHYYEGYSTQQLAFPVQVLKLLGVEKLFISNAAGGLRKDFIEGDLMLITDHINGLPNPLVGKNNDELGERFPDMFNAYDIRLRNKVKAVAEKNNIVLKEGVYYSISGPSLETPAEYKMLSILGADAVGMSTTPEVIAAKHLNLDVLAISVITDTAFEGNYKQINLENIFKALAIADPLLTKLFCGMIL